MGRYISVSFCIYYVDSNMPTPSSKFLREKCNVRIDEFFVGKVRNKYDSALVFTSGLCETFTSSKLISSANFVKSHSLTVQSKDPDKIALLKLDPINSSNLSEQS